MADFNSNRILRTHKAAAETHSNVPEVADTAGRGSGSAGTFAATAADPAESGATTSAYKVQAPQGVCGGVNSSSSSSSSTNTTNTGHQQSMRGAGSAPSCSQPSSLPLCSSPPPSASPSSVSATPPAAPSTSVSAARVAAAAAAAPEAAAPAADTCAQDSGPHLCIPSTPQGHRPACPSPSPSPSMQYRSSGPSTLAFEQAPVLPQSMSSQTITGPPRAPSNVPGGATQGAPTSVEGGGNGIAGLQAGEHVSQHARTLHTFTGDEGQRFPLHPLNLSPPQQPPNGWMQAAEERPNARDSIFSSGAGMQGQGLHASEGFSRSEQGVDFGGYGTENGRGFVPGRAGCVGREPAQAQEICSLRRVCLDSAQVVEELSMDVEDLQAQLQAAAVASACSADLEGIASLHHGVGWRDRRRAYGLHGQAKGFSLGHGDKGYRGNGDGGEGNAGDSGGKKEKGPLEGMPGIGFDNFGAGLDNRRIDKKRTLGLDSGLLERGLARRLLHEIPMQEMQVILLEK
ncbi:hypothetical protein DUNSADRAFT_1941 [Dunaliella salina]|uniref:Encoded protein n=1 Tax=Dunaliella salina TaxID=3046 RepID=A0ABQ7GWH5_DUNSA|nr:hypothetical protein DUNSADRAFT_1941 [Dunaliella salina]|eukprot:KAF5838925.1 hypothetical protein DUNSADRAFT_1941 [Dunaliella salina]